MPMSERRPSTMNSFLPAEVPQNSMAGQQILQISELQFDKIPHTFTFMYWKIRFKTQVSTLDHLFAEARSELMKQEYCEVEFIDRGAAPFIHSGEK